MYVHLFSCTGLHGDFMVAMVTHGRGTRGRMILVHREPEDEQSMVHITQRWDLIP